MTTIRSAATGQPVGKPAAAPAKPVAPARAARMSLASVTEGPQPAPLRDVIYGADGVGKTSWCADAPSPIFLPGADWPRRLKLARFPQPGNWQDVLAAIDELKNAKHAYGTFVMDAADAIEPLIWADVCAKNNASTIEEVGGGFQKGYKAALQWWRLLTDRLTELQRLRAMHVILVFHAARVKFKNPEGEDYQRWGLNVDPNAADVLRQWADNVLFMSYERRVVKAGKTAAPKGQGGQLRYVSTQWHAAYDAKNRANLPARIDLDFPAYFGAVMGGIDTADLHAEIADGIARLAPTMQATASDLLKRAGEDPLRLSKLANWIAGKLDAAEDTAEDPAPTTPESDAPALSDADVDALPETDAGISELMAGGEDPVGMVVDETADDPDAPPLGATPPTVIHEEPAPVTLPEKPAPVAAKKPPIKIGKA